MEHLTEQIDKLFAENRGAEAEKLLEQALQEAYEKQDYINAVPILNELIGYCRETGQVERSYAYADDVQEILQKLGLEGTIHHATTLLNIANAYRAGGKLEDSLHFYQKVDEIYKELPEVDDMLWASFFNNLSLLHQEMGRFDLAKRDLLIALGTVSGERDTFFEQAVTYTNLANTCLQLGQGDEAEKYFTEAIYLFEEEGIQDAHYCAALSALATYLYQEQDYELAEQFFLKAMEGIERSLGQNESYERMKDNALLCGKLARPYEAEDNVDNFISGLELCRAFYEECCAPMLQEKFPAYVDKIAVGLVGEGSDCFGYDDAYSRDHDWGPRLYLWVNEAVYEEIGAEMVAAYGELPKEYGGFVYKESAQGAGRYGVWRIGDFYRQLLGAENCPEDSATYNARGNVETDEASGAGKATGKWSAENIRWENIPDYRLAAAVNGEVFADAGGEFTQIRTLLKTGYPKRLWYLKLAESVARYAQSGQYNYTRMCKRGDKVTAQLMLTEAVKEAMRLLYYRDGEYPPHDKWLLRGLQEKEAYKQVLGLIEKLVTCRLTQDKIELLDEIGGEVAFLLYRADFISDIDCCLQEHIDELLFKASLVELSVEELAERIARVEFEAFDRVKNYGGRADCQDDWFTFSIMRKSQYLTWEHTMLMQYLYDFTREMSQGHNLIEEKYVRMMASTSQEEYVKLKDYFPVLSFEKLEIIEEVVWLQVKWMEEFATKYPKLAGNARSIHTYEDHLFNTSYETYLRGEVSTYSDKMLELYGRFIVKRMKEGKNLARDIMEHSVLMYGYEGLEDAERRME